MHFVRSRGVQIAALMSVAAAAGATGLSGIADPNPRLPGISAPSVLALRIASEHRGRRLDAAREPEPGIRVLRIQR